MKKNLFFYWLKVMSVVTVSLVSCEKKERTDDRLADSASTFQTEKGQFKKTLTVSDASGQNSVDFEFSANDETVFRAFDASVFSLEIVDNLLADDGSAFRPELEPQTTEKIDAPHSLAKSQPFFVDILSKKMAPGVRALHLKIDLDRVKTASDEAADRAATYYLGIFNNDGSAIGITNNGASCTAYVSSIFQYKNGETWLNWTFGNGAIWDYFTTKTACSGGQDNSNSELFVKIPCQLRNFKGKTWPFPRVAGVFKSTDGRKVRMLVWASSSQMTNIGQALGVFIFG